MMMDSMMVELEEAHIRCPSRMAPATSTPSMPRKEFSTPPVGRYMYAHTVPVTTKDSAKGSRISVRNSAVPFRPWSIISARPRPSSRHRGIRQNSSSVFFSAGRNWLLENIRA